MNPCKVERKKQQLKPTEARQNGGQESSLGYVGFEALDLLCKIRVRLVEVQLLNPDIAIANIVSFSLQF